MFTPLLPVSFPQNINRKRQPCFSYCCPFQDSGRALPRICNIRWGAPSTHLPSVCNSAPASMFTLDTRVFACVSTVRVQLRLCTQRNRDAPGLMNGCTRTTQHQTLRTSGAAVPGAADHARVLLSPKPRLREPGHSREGSRERVEGSWPARERGGSAAPARRARPSPAPLPPGSGPGPAAFTSALAPAPAGSPHSPGSRLISMSKWHCGRSWAPIASAATGRRRELRRDRRALRAGGWPGRGPGHLTGARPTGGHPPAPAAATRAPVELLTWPYSSGERPAGAAGA